ncbi:MAG: hypothetical protein J6T10_11145 [Methanobrevibacter sp.]|nr:hypothetical protein [Methanobrevibacter sp.]
MWNGYKNYDHYFLVDQGYEWMQEIISTEPERVPYGKKFMWNIPASFDIETSSYRNNNGEKCATSYLWSLNINGSTIVGRTWDEFKACINFVAESMHTDKNILVIYVHNLGYEFQWMKKWFTWKDVFAVKERRPVHATLDNGIEFKCSYLLSNYALSYIGNNLISRYHVKKDVGAVDYSLIRHWLTNLTDTEIWYNVHDNQVVTSFIQEKIENEGGIDKIPLTNTGYVRQYCREFCFTQMQKDEKIIKKLKAKYHERMRSLKIVSECEYDQLHLAFAGGFTHTAPNWSGVVMYDCGSGDLASSYPAVMVMKKFPMGRGTFIGECTEEDINWLTNHSFCCVFTIKMKNVYPKFIWENYISVSKCSILSPDYVSNNGRVASASELQITITEVDWDIIKKCYEWDSIEFHNLRFYPADYLPRPFILSILHLFANKTSLKGVEGKETEYMVSKNMINASYGMSVTSIVRDLYEYSNTNDWLTSDADVASQLQRYNDSYQRFLFYGWGVWVTAHARHNLWDAIFEFGRDYVYADTDSIKGINFKDHEPFFTIYNFNIETQLRQMCKYWNIDFELCQPKTITGKKKMIGVWEREDDYKLFKAIGAKRYLYEYMDGKLNFTISGVNKKFGVPYLLTEFANPNYKELYRLAYNPTFEETEKSKEAMDKLLELHNAGEISYEEIFNNFNDGLYFPDDATGKQTLTYKDSVLVDQCTDYLGKTVTIYELSYIHMEPQSYYMSQTYEYIRFLRGFRDASD